MNDGDNPDQKSVCTCQVSGQVTILGHPILGPCPIHIFGPPGILRNYSHLLRFPDEEKLRIFARWVEEDRAKNIQLKELERERDKLKATLEHVKAPSGRETGDRLREIRMRLHRKRYYRIDIGEVVSDISYLLEENDRLEKG